MLPKISIITPTYNQGKFIEQSILSVINQNYPNLEYIIIDGGSTDETISIIKKYEHKINYWISEKDTGQSNAINKGLKLASGEIINWLNSDDFLADNALQIIAKEFENKSVHVVAGYSSFVDEFGKNIDNSTFRTHVNGKNIYSIITNTSFNQPSTFFRKKHFDAITPVNENLHYNMDLYLWLRYLCLFGEKNISFRNEIFSIVSMHGEAKTIKDFDKTFIEKKYIYTSLFKNIASSNTTDDLVFEVQALLKTKKTLNFLKKYYYRYRIFKRNLAGQRIGFSLTHFVLYLYYSFLTAF